ncbi:hypothetical protein E3J48_02950 [Candidatus Aerophobetes bacterium]|uniref:Uncharacterized protein n=1 Tax=Aerophobetes bacterium TaxID=2030807 RepID=A0A523W7X7_UNCAE|nr:MAG: hypothetical protein E3J48_02950 [Candidatus Aerophobetes bacterium]
MGTSRKRRFDRRGKYGTIQEGCRGARENCAEIPLEYYHESIDVRERGGFVFASFEAHFSEGDIRDMLAVEDGKRVPVEQGKIVPRYLLTAWLIDVG